MAKHLGILIACHSAKVPILYLFPQQQAGMSKAHLITAKRCVYKLAVILQLSQTVQGILKTAGDIVALERTSSICEKNPSSLCGLYVHTVK